MKTMTIVFLVTPYMVWLAPKKRKIGKGKLNGYGGKIKPRENALQSIYRELLAESTVSVSLHPDDLEKMGEIDFYLENNLDSTCHIYLANTWSGEPRETAEMGQPWTYWRNNLPLNLMLPGDALWAPKIMLKQNIIPVSKTENRFIRYDHDRSRVLEHNLFDDAFTPNCY